MRVLYNIFFIFFSIAYLPYFLIKGKCHRDYLQRFGIFKRDIFDKIKGKRPIWIHAVSVGEMRTASILMERLRDKYPESVFVLSNITKTGNSVAQSAVTKNDIIIYFPVDISFVVRRLVNIINPGLFIFIETEIWPNLITELYDRRVPIVLMNGRISDNSFRNYRLIRPIIGSILKKVSLFCMRTDEDASRAKILGAPESKVVVSGNMKFDSALLIRHKDADEWIPIRQKEIWLKDNSRLLIAGSTHRGEDFKVIRSYLTVKEDHPELSLLIAPRHIERVNEIADIIRQSGLEPVKISDIEKTGSLSGSLNGSSKKPVFILDSMGRLSALYKLASVVFMGGSLVSKGGHNMLEPAVHGKPMITGSHVNNFRDMMELFLRSGAIKVAKDEDELSRSLDEMLSSDAMMAEMGRQAKRIVEENAGSTDRNISLISEFIARG